MLGNDKVEVVAFLGVNHRKEGLEGATGVGILRKILLQVICSTSAHTAVRDEDLKALFIIRFLSHSIAAVYQDLGLSLEGWPCVRQAT